MPHNIKVFNLCRIRRDGLAAWLAGAREIRERYFAGRMIIGTGPQVEKLP